MSPAPTPPTALTPPPVPTRTGWTLALVSLALFMVTLDNLVVTFALPSIRLQFHVDLALAGMDGQRLHPELCRPAALRSRAR